MYYLRTEESFDAAHFLKDYDGKCSNLHGHRWRVACEAAGEALREDPQELGMLMDFGDLKAALRAICAEYDHRFLYEAGSLRAKTVEALTEEGFELVPLPARPTAENLARLIWERLAAMGIPVSRVEVWETPNNCAAYEPDREAEA